MGWDGRGVTSLSMPRGCLGEECTVDQWVSSKRVVAIVTLSR